MSVRIGLLAAVVVLLLVRRSGKGVAQEEGGWVENVVRVCMVLICLILIFDIYNR